MKERTVKEARKIWKDLGITKALIKFDCGGDSMGDMIPTFYNSKDEEIEVDDDMKSLFCDECFDHVQFHENSDGYYMGESGEVKVSKKGRYGFSYVKDSISEYSEEKSDTITIDVTPEEEALFNKSLFVLGDIEHIILPDSIITEEETNLFISIERKSGIAIQKLRESSELDVNDIDYGPEPGDYIAENGKAIIPVVISYTTFRKD